MTDEQLIRLLIKETIKAELNEFWGNSKEDAAVTAAKKMLDAHFSGIGKKYDDSVVNNLISKLSPEDQKVYKAKLSPKPQQQTQQKDSAFGIARTNWRQQNAHAQDDIWGNVAESKKRRKAALR